MAEATDVRLLGPIVVAGPAGEAALVGVRQRTVVGLLALDAGVVVPRHRLVDALWGEDQPRTAVRTLHSHVSRVRQALDVCGLSGVLVLREPGYVLTVPREWVDAHRFEGAVRTARTDLSSDPARAAAVLRDALALWRGDALADGELHGWAAAQVRRFDEARLTASEDLWDLTLSLGGHTSAVVELDRLCAGHPTRERLVALLMQALYRTGRTAEALERYERFRVRLAEELGADPGPALQRLHLAILRGEAGPEPAPAREVVRVTPAELPPPAGYFAGRRTELSTLDQWLGTEENVTVISGPAGIGKTSLAVQWAHRVAGRFPDGQIVLDLNGHDPDAALRPEEVLAHVLRGLGVPADRIPATMAGRLGLYRSLVHGRRLLLVLDNAGTADHVLPVVPATADSLLVVTSRRRLAALAAHHAVRRIELDVLDAGDALALLRRVLGAERVDREPARAGELVELCDRIPLALRIAAARLTARPRQPIAELVEELAGADRLDALSVDGDGRSVRAVFAGAYQALSEPAVRLFRLLGLHPGGTFTTHLAAAVAGLPHGRARRSIDELAGAFLITEVTTGRYRFHDLIRLYAEECARVDEDPDERAAATSRLRDWYLAIADAANRILDPRRDRVVPAVRVDPPFAAEPDAALAFLDGERANVMAVVAHAGTAPVAWQLAYLVAGYFESRGHADDRVTVYRHGLAAAQQVGGADCGAVGGAIDGAGGGAVPEGLMRSGLGVACIAARRHDEALGHLGEALELMRSAGDRRGEGHALNNIAVALMWLRRYDEAIDVCAEALAVHEANGHLHGTILALNNLGYVYGQAGRTAQSLEHLGRGLDLARRDGDVRLEAVFLNTMGETHEQAGADAEALVCFEKALALRRDTGNRHYEARSLNAIGATHLRLGAPAAARTAFGEAYRLARWLGDAHLEATALANLGRGLLAGADLIGARDVLGQALALRTAVPDEYEEATLLCALGELEQRSGEPDRADGYWDRAARLYEKANAGAEAAAVADRRRAATGSTPAPARRRSAVSSRRR